MEKNSSWGGARMVLVDQRVLTNLIRRSHAPYQLKQSTVKTSSREMLTISTKAHSKDDR